MADRQITGFTRDPSLSADIADQFGGGGVRAEQMIAANELRYTEDLLAANLAVEDVEARGKYDASDVAGATDLPEDSIKGVTKRGNYLVYVFVTDDGRPGKDTLLVEKDGSLTEPEREDTPEKAALRAQVASTAKVREAQSEADRILEKAREEAAEILRKAAEQGQKDGAESLRESVERAQSGDSRREKPTTDDAASGQRTPARKPSQVNKPKQ